MDIAPIKYWGEKLVQSNICKKDDLGKVDEEVEEIIKDGIKFARTSSLPEPEDALRDMYAVEYKGIPDKGWIRLKT